MVTVEILDALKKFITNQVASKVKLQKEDTDIDDPDAFVNPYVEICYMPHKNFLPQGHQVPFILIGYDNGVDDGSEATENIRIVFATYGGGCYYDSEGKKTKMPDAKGYIDLLNLIDRTKRELASSRNIEGVTAVNPPFVKGTYDTEQPTWPYWYGYLTFEAAGAVDDYVMKDPHWEGVL